MNLGCQIPSNRAEEVRNPFWPDQPDVKPIRTRELTPLVTRYDHDEIALLRQTMAKTNAGMRAVRTRVHNAISAAPEIDRLIEETRRTPFTERITSVWIRDVGKLGLPFYEGKTEPKVNMTAFRIAVGRAYLNDDERDTS